MKSNFVVVLLAIILAGCETIGHKEFYTQVAPTKYPPTKEVKIFEYANVNLDEVYEILFSDFLIIGKSSFNGPYEKPAESISYAESIGANIFITSSQFKETKTSFMTMQTPTTNRTYINGSSASGTFSGTATSYGTQTTTVPISVDRYSQNGIYLRNINNITPLWERKSSDYSKSSGSQLDGLWHNENYGLNLYKSNDQYVAFVENATKDIKAWKKDDLKFVFGVESGVGIYMMGDKTPMPASFKLNKFGHLEVTLITSGEKFSFTK